MKKSKFKKMTCWAIEREDGTLATIDKDCWLWAFPNRAKGECCRFNPKTERLIRVDIVPHRGEKR